MKAVFLNFLQMILDLLIMTIVIWYMWDWFVAGTLTQATLTLGSSAGISLIIHYLFNARITPADASWIEETSEWRRKEFYIKCIFHHFTLAVVFLAIGYLVKINLPT